VSSPRSCRRCLKPLPDALSDGTCPSCGFAVNWNAETPKGEATPHDRDDAFELGSDPHATASHVPTTVREEPAFRKPLPHFPDIPNHTDFEVIGRGGMGTVYRAIQRPTDRTVAVKVVNYFIADSPMRERYINEVRAHARVRHPGIIPIFEVGDCSHGPYFTMEYQPGGTLAQRIKAGKLDDRESARIVAEAAEAVHAAHAEGIVHRDIKPSNILVDDAGRVRVTDFGLAKHASGDDITQSGVIVGTFAYMSPEQAAGNPSKIGPPADIYCLGSTLFQLLTGRVAHPAKGSDLATVRRIVHGPSPTARTLRSNLCPTLDAIVRKSMERDPADRYATAADFARDLGRWLAGESTDAKPLTLGQRMRRLARPHRAATAWMLAISLLLVAAAVAVRDRDPALRFERAMKRGVPFELVGDDGQPRPCRWLIGEAMFAVAPDGPKEKAFSSGWVSLAALVEDPHVDRYRFLARFRHIGGSRSRANEEVTENAISSAGVFWGYESESVGSTVVHFVATLDFHDRPAAQRKNVRSLQTRVRAFVQYPDKPIEKFRIAFTPPVSYDVTERPLGEPRTVEVAVDPGGCTIQWGDGDQRRELWRITDSELNEQFTAIRNQVRSVVPELSPRGPAWSPRRPLGMIGMSATVSVPRFTMTPQP
jgi:eukaryotic-like serine/threonine-protein kinase